MDLKLTRNQLRYRGLSPERNAVVLGVAVGGVGQQHREELKVLMASRLSRF